jgi:S1-C subfamily serine protease
VSVTIAGVPPQDDDATGSTAATAAGTPVTSPDLALVLAPLPREVLLRLGMADQGAGVLVDQVRSGGAAEDAGISAGSVIANVGGTAVASPSEAQSHLQDRAKAPSILLLIWNAQGLRRIALPRKPS